MIGAKKENKESRITTVSPNSHSDPTVATRNSKKEAPKQVQLSREHLDKLTIPEILALIPAYEITQYLHLAYLYYQLYVRKNLLRFGP